MHRLHAVAAVAALVAGLPGCSIYLGEDGDPRQPPDAAYGTPDAARPDATPAPDAGGAPDAGAAHPLEIAFVTYRDSGAFLMRGNRRGELSEIAGPFHSLKDLAVSPTGTHVALSWYVVSDWRLLVVRIADGAFHVVGSGEAVGLPSWSPDGAQLVYEGWAGGNAAPEVIRASLDGSDVEVLARATSADWSCVAPVWSPDGREIAYASEGALRVRAVATGAVRTIATGTRVCRPAWSPDGRVVAFTHGDRDAPRLTIVGRGGGTPRELARRGVIDPYARPAWAPDGRSIAYGDHDPALGSMVLRRVDIGDPDPSSLAEADGTAAVHWSSDGGAILFERWSDSGSIGLWNVEQGREEDFFPGPPALRGFHPVWLPR